MKTQILHNRLERYIKGEALPTETRQIQTWLSCTTTSDIKMSAEQKQQLELEILQEIQAETAYPLFYPKEKPWWQKMQKALNSFL